MTIETMGQANKLFKEINKYSDIISQLDYILQKDKELYTYLVGIRVGTTNSWQTIPCDPGPRLGDMLAALKADYEDKRNKCEEEFSKL